MAQNEPQRKENPPGPSPNSPSLLFEYQCRSGKFIGLANRIEKIDSVARIESKLFLPELECSSSYRPTRQNYLVALGGVNMASQIQERRSAFSTDKNERWSRFIFRFSALNSVRESYCHLFKNTQLSPLGRTVSSRR